MTKREFDRLTKENWGGDWMASDERQNYRERRLRSRDTGCSLANRRGRNMWPGSEKYRNVMRYRVRTGRSLAV